MWVFSDNLKIVKYHITTDCNQEQRRFLLSVLYFIIYILLSCLLDERLMSVILFAIMDWEWWERNYYQFKALPVLKCFISTQICTSVVRVLCGQRRRHHRWHDYSSRAIFTLTRSTTKPLGRDRRGRMRRWASSCVCVFFSPWRMSPFIHSYLISMLLCVLRNPKSDAKCVHFVNMIKNLKNKKLKETHLEMKYQTFLTVAFAFSTLSPNQAKHIYSEKWFLCSHWMRKSEHV